MVKKLKLCCALAVLGFVAIAGIQIAPVLAEPAPPIKRTLLQKFDVPGTNFETVIGVAEIVPNVNIGKHTHPEPESSYVLEDDFVLLIDGQPPLPLKAGMSYKVPTGAAHDGKTGAAGAKVLATYVVEKGKPLASPAP